MKPPLTDNGCSEQGWSPQPPMDDREASMKGMVAAACFGIAVVIAGFVWWAA